MFLNGNLIGGLFNSIIPNKNVNLFEQGKAQQFASANIQQWKQQLEQQQNFADKFDNAWEKAC